MYSGKPLCQSFMVSRQAAKARHPGEAALDYPTTRQQPKAIRGRGQLDDFQADTVGLGSSRIPFASRSGIKDNRRPRRSQLDRWQGLLVGGFVTRGENSLVLPLHEPARGDGLATFQLPLRQCGRRNKVVSSMIIETGKLDSITVRGRVAMVTGAGGGIGYEAVIP
jgi:hypothetical protein